MKHESHGFVQRFTRSFSTGDYCANPELLLIFGPNERKLWRPNASLFTTVCDE